MLGAGAGLVVTFLSASSVTVLPGLLPDRLDQTPVCPLLAMDAAPPSSHLSCRSVNVGRSLPGCGRASEFLWKALGWQSQTCSSCLMSFQVPLDGPRVSQAQPSSHT